jgi:hypothetical protein
LAEALDSALAQTHPRVEVIVVDDGSNADVAAALTGYLDRVRFFRKENGGLASARNHGIGRAAGEYLMFLDDDDFLEPTSVEDLLAALDTCPGAAWAAGRYDYVDERGTPLSRPARRRYDSGDVYRDMICGNLIGAPCVVLAAAERVRQVGCFDETRCYHMAEDYDLWLSLARSSPLAATQRKVSNYRVHGQQFTQNHRARHSAALLAVLQKQRALAPPGHDQEFRLAIARLHVNCGDSFYLDGEASQARAEWRKAAEGGALSGLGLRKRVAKSHIPYAITRVLRFCRQSAGGAAAGSNRRAGLTKPT